MSNHDAFVTTFDRLYVEQRARQEQEIGRKLHAGEVAILRTLLRTTLKQEFAAEVAAIEHFNARNLEYNRQTGRPFPAHSEMNGDPLWLLGANLEGRLRALTTARSSQRRLQERGERPRSERQRKFHEANQERLGNVKTRYTNLVKKYGYVPSDDLTVILSGVSHRQAVELRVGLIEEFNLIEHQHGENVPEMFRPYWVATPKEDSTAKLVNIIQGLDDDNRKALIELLASIKNGS